MGVTVTHRNKIAVRANPHSVQRMGERAAKTIRDRTRAGISLRGQNFSPYTTGYAQFRKDHGKSARVDLTFSRELLDSLRVLGMGIDTRRAVVSIGFLPGAHRGTDVSRGQIGKWLHYGTKYMRPRPFMGLTRAEHRMLIDFATDKILVQT